LRDIAHGVGERAGFGLRQVSVGFVVPGLDEEPVREDAIAPQRTDILVSQVVESLTTAATVLGVSWRGSSLRFLFVPEAVWANSTVTFSALCHIPAEPGEECR